MSARPEAFVDGGADCADKVVNATSNDGIQACHVWSKAVLT